MLRSSDRKASPRPAHLRTPNPHPPAAGLSSTLPDQLQQVFGVIDTGLSRVSASHRAAAQSAARAARREEERRIADAHRWELIRNGTWHDGRLDCVAGNGVMCELGVGDEPMGAADMDTVPPPAAVTAPLKDVEKHPDEAHGGEERGAGDAQAVGTLPLVVIRNYAARGAGAGTSAAGQEALLGALAQWAASLAENQVRAVRARVCGV